MKEKLDSILGKDEELLWFGSPESFETMDKTNGNSIKVGIVLKAVIMAALIAGYVIIAAREGIMLGVILFLLAAAAYLILSPFLTARTLRKSVGYAVTDKRLIHIASDAKGIGYSAIREAALKTDADGHVTLLCGKDALKLSEHKWRNAATFPIRIDDETKECDCLVFYALPESEKVRELLSQYISL